MIQNPGFAAGVPGDSSPKHPQRNNPTEQMEELRKRISSQQPSEQTFSLPVLGRRGKNTGKTCIHRYTDNADIHRITDAGRDRILPAAYRLHARNRAAVYNKKFSIFRLMFFIVSFILSRKAVFCNEEGA